MGKRGYCVACKGLRFGDRPQKRVALGAIAANSGHKNSNYSSRFGYKQCDVFLCNNSSCFEVFFGRSRNIGVLGGVPIL